MIWAPIPKILARDIQAAGRGVDVPRSTMKFRDVLDGLANTIAAGEIDTDLGDNEIRTRTRNAGFDVVMNNPSVCRVGIDPENPTKWSPTVFMGPSFPLSWFCLGK